MIYFYAVGRKRYRSLGIRLSEKVFLLVRKADDGRGVGVVEDEVVGCTVFGAGGYFTLWGESEMGLIGSLQV